jgi:hypothetical protein
MPQQPTEEASDPLMHRSATSLALLAVFTIGAFLISLIGPTAAGAQTAPGDATTSTTAAPTTSTTVPATSTTEAPAEEPLSTSPTTAAPSTLTPPTAMAEPTRPEAAQAGGPRNLSEATYVYTPREIKRAWNNSHHDKITLAKATQLSRYMNAVVANQIQQYLLAVYLNAVANAQVPGQAGWERVAACETGGNWNTNTGNGFFGGLQFSLSTWRSVGGSGYPHQNSKAEQMRRANILKDRAGLGQWPHCGARFHG